MRNKILSNIFKFLMILSFTLFFWSIYLKDGLSPYLYIFLVLMIIFAIAYLIISHKTFFETLNYRNKKVYIITKIIYSITIFLGITLININTQWALVVWLLFLILFFVEVRNQKD